MPPVLRAVLAVCFFFGGATSLVLEVAWAKELSYGLGNTFYAAATVVGAFMAGLGLGSELAGRRLRGAREPLLIYAGVQLALGVCGALSIPVLRATHPLFAGLYRALEGHPQLFFGARFAAVFALLLVPVTLMGVTLPLVAGVFARARQRYAFETGLLYGINTVGAVTGTLTAGYLLIPALGLSAACAAVGTLDVLIALAAYVMHARFGAALPQPSPDTAADGALRTRATPGRAAAVGWLYLASGLAAIALEVAWFRFLAFVFGPTAEAFSMMLALFLVGVGLGSLVGAGRARRACDAFAEVARLQLLIGAAVVATLALYDFAPAWYGRLYFALPRPGGDSPIFSQALVAAFVVLPATLAMGAIFPVAVRCFAEASGGASAAERTVGRLYALNTWGGILGSFLGGFLLLPSLGLWRTLLATAALNLLIALGFLALGRATRRRVAASALAGAAAFALAVALLPRLDLLALTKGGYMALSNPTGFENMMDAHYDPNRRLLFYREGVNSNVAVTANEGGSGGLYLRIAGKPEAGTRIDGRAHLVFLGQLPVLLAREPRRVAVIGFGAGVTTSALATHPELERIDVLELEPAIIEASRFFAESTDAPLSDPRVRVVIEDARTYLGYSRERYDVITSDPISPMLAGASNLYTTDFYRLMGERLAPGGVFCQWLEAWIPSERTYGGIVRSVLREFAHVAIFTVATDSVILASNDPLVMPWPELERRFGQPRVRANLASLEITSPAELLGFFVAGDASLRAWLGRDGLVNSDDDNWVERQMPRDLNRLHGPSLEQGMFRRFAVSRIADLEAMVPGYPADAVVQAAIAPSSLLAIGFSDELRRGFERHYRDLGDDAMLARMAAWERAELERRATRLTREHYAELVREAREARAKGRREDERRALEELLEHPFQFAYYEAGLAFAELELAAGREAGALELARRLERGFPAHLEAYLFEMRVLEARGDADAAERVRERARLYAPGAPELAAAPAPG